MSQGLVANVNEFQPENVELRQARKMFEPGALDFCAAQHKCLQTLQTGDVNEPCICDARVVEVEFGKGGHRRQVRHAGIGDLQIDRFELG